MIDCFPNKRGDGGGEEAMAECLVAYGKYHFDRGERERAERDFEQALDIRDDAWSIQNFYSKYQTYRLSLAVLKSDLYYPAEAESHIGIGPLKI